MPWGWPGHVAPLIFCLAACIPSTKENPVYTLASIFVIILSLVRFDKVCSKVPHHHRRYRRMLMKWMLYIVSHDIMAFQRGKYDPSWCIVHITFLHAGQRIKQSLNIQKLVNYPLNFRFHESFSLPGHILLWDKGGVFINKVLGGSNAVNGQLPSVRVISMKLFDICVKLLANTFLQKWNHGGPQSHPYCQYPPFQRQEGRDYRRRLPYEYTCTIKQKWSLGNLSLIHAKRTSKDWMAKSPILSLAPATWCSCKGMVAAWSLRDAHTS